MMDVEQLLQETLADPRHRLEPVPGMYETVRERARVRRQRVVRLASAMAAIVLIAGVATAIGVNAQHHGRVAAELSTTPSPTTASPATGEATPIDLGKGSTSSFAVTPTAVFVARTEPDQLVEVSPAKMSIVKRVATPDPVDGTAADAAAGIVWTWSSTQSSSSDELGTGSTSIYAYKTSTLAMVAGISIPAYTFSAAALNGDLWLATSDGLYVVTHTADRSSGITKVVGGSVFSVAADAVRNRILYGSAVGTPAAGTNSLGSIAVHEMDPTTHAVFGVGKPLPIGKESIAIVGDQIWVGGYGSGSTPRLFHLDGSSLQPIATSNLDTLQLGPGAIVWPGQSVLWVRSGGSEALSCVDPQTGTLYEHWDAVQGPVTSIAGHAYAASDGSLDQLSLSGGCAS